jgi:protease-4
MMLIVVGSQSMNLEASNVSVPSIGNEKFVEGDKNSSNKILLIPVNGIIMESERTSSFYEKSMVQQIIDEFERARDDKNIKAIVMSINSPGGGVTDCDGIYKKIMEFKEKRPEVPIVVSMQDVAASGGYYISAPATKIFAQPTTITGSIGVIMEFINFQELFNKLGLEQVTFKSGKLKDIGSATREMTKEEKDILNNLVLEMSSRFIQIVKDGRKLDEGQLKIVSDARVFTASQAIKVGLVDQIGYLSDAYNSAKDLAHLPDARLVRYKKQFSFFDYLEETSKDLKPKSEIDKVKELVPLTPRMMYLWRY